MVTFMNTNGDTFKGDDDPGEMMTMVDHGLVNDFTMVFDG